MIADPYAIFAQAQRHWQAAAYPAHARYGIVVTVSRSGVTSQAHYHASYDASQNRVDVNPVSDEQLEHPYTPHGINFGFSFFGGSVPLSAPQHTFDYLGVPVLAPNYAFGVVPTGPVNTTPNPAQLVREIRSRFHDPAPVRAPQPDGEKLKTIAEVVVAHRQYVITLEGTQPLDGHVDYHLLLKPVTDPSMYRIREMWVDTATYMTDRMLTAGNFTAGALGGVRWQIDYREVDGAPFIASESALSGFTLDRRHYDSATVAFTDITPSSSPPAFSHVPRFTTDAQTAPPELSEPAKPIR